VETNYERNLKLFNAGIISRQQMDASTTQLKKCQISSFSKERSSFKCKITSQLKGCL
jgi:membrane fusion protein, multidrug efflux system